MVSYNKLREFLADIEHQQWVVWSKKLADELNWIRLDCLRKDMPNVMRRIETRLKSWQKNWKPYKKLSEDTKDMDREWADKILDALPIRCPMYQCGGFMEAKERKVSKSFLAENWEHWNGDEQSPDLICTNCKALYQFQGFKNAKRK